MKSKTYVDDLKNKTAADLAQEQLPRRNFSI